jgi:ElaB/YqjD/DUF883 family membrane-anchored ribosome-binding protein
VGEATTDDVRREIEATRDELGETIDAIGDRVIPGRVIERRKNQVNQGVRSVVDRVMGKAHDAREAVGDAGSSVGEAPGAVLSQTRGAPLVAGALAFGVGFLVAAAFPPSQTEKDAVADNLADKVEPVKAQLTQVGQEVADHLKEPAAEAVQSVKAAAQDAAQQVTSSAKDAAQETGGEVKGAVEDVRSGS